MVSKLELPSTYQTLRRKSISILLYCGEGGYREPKTVFEKLQDIGIHVDLKNRFYLFTTVYDFEGLFDDQGLPNNTDLLHFQTRHESLSVSKDYILNKWKLPGYQEKVVHSVFLRDHAQVLLCS